MEHRIAVQIDQNTVLATIIGQRVKYVGKKRDQLFNSILNLC